MKLEYLQYSQPTAAPHKRGQSACLSFRCPIPIPDEALDLRCPRPPPSRCLPLLLLCALSDWLHSINVPVGTTARYCLVALLAVYLAPQRTTARCTERSIPDGPDHIASGVCFTHSWAHCCMRVETSAFGTLKNRLRNINVLTRIAEEVVDREPESDAGVSQVSIRNEATMEEKRPV